jgi:hypothetical protein
MSTPRRLVIVAADGSGNFSTIPQAILSLAQANQVTIFIKSGTYTITSPVDLPSNLWIIGDPNAVPLIKNGGTFPSDPGKGRGVFEVRGSSSAPKQNVQIRNIRFQGSGSWDGGDFIRADYATQLVFENIQAYNTGRHMIRCDHCVDTTITNLFGDTANSNMLRLLNSTNVLVEKSQFKNAGGWSDEGGTILASGVGSSNIRVLTTTIYNDRGDQGIDFAGVTNGEISHCTIDTTYDAGIYVTRSTGIVVHDCIVKNSCTGVQYAGIVFGQDVRPPGNTNGKVLNNVVDGSGGDGIVAIGTSILVQGNTVTNCVWNAYATYGGFSSNITYRGNVGTNCGDKGAWLKDGTNMLYENNTLTNNHGFGYLQQGQCAYITIRRNDLRFNAQGAMVTPGTNIVIEDNLT